MKFETLEWYLTNAEKIIKSSKYYQLATSEDAISTVARYMMMADEKFNGTGTRKGFRYSYAIFGIKRYLSNEQIKPEGLSLNDHNLLAVLESKNVNEVIFKDVVEYLNNVEYLRYREKDAILRYYVEGRNLREIAKIHNVTCECVRLNIKAGLFKVKENLNVELV